jgi:hypothetical protein
MAYPAHYYSLRIVQNDLSLDMMTHDAHLAQRQLSQWLNALLGDTWLQGQFAGHALAISPPPPATVGTTQISTGPLPATVMVPEALPVALHQPVVKPAEVSPSELGVSIPVMTQSTEAALTVPEILDTPPQLINDTALPPPVVDPVAEVVAAEPDEFETVLGTLMNDEPSNEDTSESQTHAVNDVKLPTNSNPSPSISTAIPAVSATLPKRLYTRIANKTPISNLSKPSSEAVVRTVAIDIAPDPFEAIAEKTPSNDQTAPAISTSVNQNPVKTKTLSDLCAEAKPSNPEAYLLLASYYLTFFEQTTAFSLKRINTLMAASGLMPLNHSVLEQALAKDYLVMVPDLTGDSNSIEYELTESGQLKARTML